MVITNFIVKNIDKIQVPSILYLICNLLHGIYFFRSIFFEPFSRQRHLIDKSRSSGCGKKIRKGAKS